MNTKIFNNARFTPKGDIEANWNKATGFVPLDKEIIIYKKDAEHPMPRVKIGDGVTVVQDLPFFGGGSSEIDTDDFLTKEEYEEFIMELDNVITEIVTSFGNKLDKTGGIISGDLSIQGDLNVAGTTTTKDTETVLVKDNVVVTNSDGDELIEEAGFAIKTGADTAYGIMYDPVGDGVKIGLGTFDENGKFEYTEGEDQFLATRDNSIADGSLVKWDDDAKKLVDAGNDYVKFTDYATSQKAGLVKVSTSYGLSVSGEGALAVNPANETEIEAQTNSYKPITPKRISKAIKVGLITNTETLTDEEKASACEWLGALKQYEHTPLQKEPNINYLYAVDAYNGTQKMIKNGGYTITAAWSIPSRDANGNIRIPDYDSTKTHSGYPAGEIAINKNYVDNLVGNINTALEAILGV